MDAPNRPSRQWVHLQLCRGSWYPSLPAALQNELIESSLVRMFTEGEYLVEQDCHPEGLYAVLEGQVGFLRRLPEDREFLLDVAGPGFWFADPSVLLGEPMPHTVVARRDLRVMLIPTVKANRIREQNTTFSNHFARLHARRFLTAVNGVADAAVLPREHFLRRRLTDLALLTGAADNQDCMDVAISQSELALMIGVSRQTLNGYLAELESQGLLTVGYRSITLHRSILSGD